MIERDSFPLGSRCPIPPRFYRSKENSVVAVLPFQFTRSFHNFFRSVDFHKSDRTGTRSSPYLRHLLICDSNEQQNRWSSYSPAMSNQYLRLARYLHTHRIPRKGSSVMRDDAKYELREVTITTGVIINQQTTMRINQPKSPCYIQIRRTAR